MTRWYLAVGAVALLGVGVLAGALLFPRVEHVPASRPSAVDVGFTQDMVAHHQQAVDMSRLVEDRAGGQVSAIAATISVAQLTEIGRMQGWLEVWGAPQVSADPMAWMSHEGEHGKAMGMASTADLQSLQTLRGKRLDVHFLQLMIRHHQGAIRMASAAADRATREYVRTFARSVIAGQGQEILTLTRTLRALGG